MAAILVVNDGETWLPSALRSLRAQDYPALDIVAVDNGSKDGSRSILTQHLDAADVITVNRNTGFGRAVRAARRHPAVQAADHVMLVHDDLALTPDALRVLVDAIEEDPALGIVGPKLREWATAPLLQEVGMTADRFGRAETAVERGELDQGHLDGRREVLYVSTAGMLVRAEALDELDGFDPRFTGLRDDLDLCWRAWLLGWRVEVVTDAVGYHVAAGTRGARRLWRERSWQARFLSERHALASLLKNYSLRRLAWVLPLALLLGLAKVVGFSLTRRFSDVRATLRAYAWNLVELPRTLRERRRVQRARRRSDAEIGRLFATGLPRVQDYTEALRDRLASPDAPSLLSEPDDAAKADPGQQRRLRGLARKRPALVVGLLLAVTYLIGLVPLLGSGQLIGGTVLPWPDDPWAFLRAYASPVAGDPLATDVSASPLHTLLGGIGIAVLGNAWLAQRLVVLGLLPLAWVTALRAGRLVTGRRGPRVVGATLYALSPVVLGALAQGRLGELVVAALLPMIVLLTARVASARSERARAWRATAWLALASATAVAAAPGLWVVVAPVLLVGFGVAAAGRARAAGRPLLRITVATGGGLALLAPWLWDLLRSGTSLELPPAVRMPAWRALALAPTTVPGLEGDAAYVVVAVTAAVLVLALLLGVRLRPLPVAALVAALVLSAAMAWSAGQLGVDWVWSPALLLPGAAALAGLAVVAGHTMGPALRAYTFGLPQLVVLVAMVPLAVGVGGAVWKVAGSPWEALDRDVELVPPYVTAETDRVGPYRVLVVDESGGEVRWGVTEAGGPSMVSFGTARSPQLTSAIDASLSRVLAGDLDGGAGLGLANVRYVVLADELPDLRATLAEQPDLEPMVAGGGQVFLVRHWLPRAAALPTEVAESLLATGRARELPAHEEAGLRRAGAAAFEGLAPDDQTTVVLSEERGLWEGRAGVSQLTPVPAQEGLPIEGFVAADAAEGAPLSIGASQTGWRTGALIGQALVFLALFSLVLRPPGSAKDAVQRLRSDAELTVPSPLTDSPPPLESRPAVGLATEQQS